MGVWGRVGYATLSIDDRQFISGIYYWHGVCGDLNFTERRDNKLFHKHLQPNGQQLFPFGHNTRTDTAGCQVTLYICIYCVNGWMSYIYIDTSLHVLVRSIELYTFPCYRCKSVALQKKLGWHAEQVCQQEFAAELQVCSYYMGRQWMNVVCNSVLLQYLNYQGFNSVAAIL